MKIMTVAMIIFYTIIQNLSLFSVQVKMAQCCSYIDMLIGIVEFITIDSHVQWIKKTLSAKNKQNNSEQKVDNIEEYIA